jgi:hypothetical protein
MAGEVDAERLALKRFQQRNSDGKFSFGDDYGQGREMQEPPAFQEEAHELPPSTVRASNPEDGIFVEGAELTGDQARAIRQVHVFDPLVVEPA